MEWSPNLESIQFLAGILSLNNTSDSKVVSNSYNQLEEAKKNPEFLKYIVYIYAFGDKLNLGLSCRVIAGFTLKSCIKFFYGNESQNDKQFIRNCVLQALIDPNYQIRNAAGVIISQIVVVGTLEAWPDLLPALTDLLKSNDANYIITSLSCLSKMMEDDIFAFDSDKVGNPLNNLIPIFLSFFTNENEEVVYHSVCCMRFTIDAMPNALLVNMNNYLQGLSWLLTRANDSTLAQICTSLVSILGVRVDALAECLNDVFSFMVQMSQHSNTFVATQATEFWSVFATLDEGEELFSQLRPFLPTLVPLLMNNMRYSNEELERRNVDSTAQPDANGVRPFIYHEDKSERNSKESEDYEGEWTLRKASAWALDCLSNPYAGEVLEIVSPMIESGLNSNDWIVQECSIFTVGAISGGCHVFMGDMMNTLYPYLLQLIQTNENPLLYSIAAWTIQQFADWLLDSMEPAQIDLLMNTLLQKMFNEDRKIQNSSVTCIAILVETGEEKCQGYYDAIIRTICQCFTFYCESNQRALLYCISDICTVLMDAPNVDINQYADMLLPPIINKWNLLGDLDEGLLSILECLYYLISAMGTNFASLGADVFTRCVRIIDTVNIAYSTQTYETESLPDKMFLTSSLDVISSVVGSLQAAAQALIEQSNLVSVMVNCMNDNEPTVRQSAFGLLGDMVINCFPVLSDQFTTIVKLCVEHMNLEHPSVCNNAIWSLGELTVKVGDAIAPYIDSILPLLLSINSQTRLAAGVKDNSTITICRMAMVAPMVTAPLIKNFYGMLCMNTAKLRDTGEKTDATRGLCRALQVIPEVMPELFPQFIALVASWDQISDMEIGQMMLEVMNGVKGAAGNSWQSFYEQKVDIRYRQIIQNNFNFY